MHFRNFFYFSLIFFLPCMRSVREMPHESRHLDWPGSEEMDWSYFLFFLSRILLRACPTENIPHSSSISKTTHFALFSKENIPSVVVRAKEVPKRHKTAKTTKVRSLGTHCAFHVLRQEVPEANPNLDVQFGISCRDPKKPCSYFALRWCGCGLAHSCQKGVSSFWTGQISQQGILFSSHIHPLSAPEKRTQNKFQQRHNA